MKLRMQANSIRLRVKRSELAQLAKGGSIEEVVRLARSPSGTFRYVLASSQQPQAVQVQYEPSHLRVVLSTDQLETWRDEREVGIYVDMEDDDGGVLHVLIEKDFACLDGSDVDNKDTFPNPTVADHC